MNIVALNRQTVPVNVVDGSSLAHRRLTSAARVRLAYQLSIGQATLVRPTQSQCARLMGVGTSAVAMAGHRSRQPGVRPPMSDMALERLVKRVGPDRFFAVIDRLTAPAVMS